MHDLIQAGVTILQGLLRIGKYAQHISQVVVQLFVGTRMVIQIVVEEGQVLLAFLRRMPLEKLLSLKYVVKDKICVWTLHRCILALINQRVVVACSNDTLRMFNESTVEIRGPPTDQTCIFEEGRRLEPHKEIDGECDGNKGTDKVTIHVYGFIVQLKE